MLIRPENKRSFIIEIERQARLILHFKFVHEVELDGLGRQQGIERPIEGADGNDDVVANDDDDSFNCIFRRSLERCCTDLP